MGCLSAQVCPRLLVLKGRSVQAARAALLQGACPEAPNLSPEVPAQGPLLQLACLAHTQNSHPHCAFSARTASRESDLNTKPGEGLPTAAILGLKAPHLHRGPPLHSEHPSLDSTPQSTRAPRGTLMFPQLSQSCLPLSQGSP